MVATGGFGPTIVGATGGTVVALVVATVVSTRVVGGAGSAVVTVAGTVGDVAGVRTDLLVAGDARHHEHADDRRSGREGTGRRRCAGSGARGPAG